MFVNTEGVNIVALGGLLVSVKPRLIKPNILP